MKTFKTEYEKLKREQVTAKNPEAMKTGYFDHVWEMKQPNSAAQLEELIVQFLRMKGHQAANVTTTGVYRDNTKIVTDVLGFRRKIGTAKWTKGKATKGASDISATLKPSGLTLAIEVKFSKSDRQRKEQKQYQHDIETAGGFYLIVRSVDDFYEQYLKLLDHPKIKLLNSLDI